MSGWGSAVPAFLISIALICLPGLLIAWGLRIRGFGMIIAAVPASLAVIALSSIIAPLVGITWNLVAPLALASLLFLLALLLRHYLPSLARITAATSHLRWPLIGSGLAAVVITVTLFGSMPRIDAVSQTYDAVFHLNAVRHILDTGSASPFDMDLTSPGRGVFYPTLWHALVSLTAQLSGASIPMATSATLFAVSAFVWPIGIIALSRAVAGPSVRATMIASILSAAIPGMPFILASYGVVYPTLLAFALLPFAFLGVMQLFSAARARSADPLTPVARWLLLVGTLGAAIMSQPSTLHTTLMFIGPFVLLAVLRRFRRSRELRTRLIAASSAVLFLLVSLATWVFGNTGRSPWSPRHNFLGALVDGIGSTPHIVDNNWPVAIFTIVGLFLAFVVPRARAFALSYVVFLLVYGIADGFPSTLFRDAVLTPWYGDPWRLAALMSLVIIPLATFGATTLSGLILPPLRRLVRQGLPLPVQRGKWIAPALLLVFFFATVIGPGMTPMRDYVTKKYEDGEEAALLSQDERQLLERLKDELPADAVLLTNPWNGGSLAYAISGHQVLIPHTGGRYDPDALVMAAGIALGTPAACSAADKLETQYLLDFGSRFVMKDKTSELKTEQLRHIDNIKDPRALDEVDRQGDAALFRISGC